MNFLFWVALLVTGVAAYFDLRTTESPDYLPFGLFVASVLFYGAVSFLSADGGALYASLTNGTIFLLVGILLYGFGWWGGADALLLGALGYALPSFPAAYTLTPVFSFLVGFFLIGAIYSIFYSIRYLWGHGEYLCEAARFFRERSLYLLSGGFFLLGLFRGVESAVSFTVGGTLLVFLFVTLLVLDRRAFFREIPVSSLEVGSVLGKPVRLPSGTLPARRIMGLSGKEVEDIRAHLSVVWVRSGVPFLPVYPLTLIFIALVGDPVRFVFLLLM